MAKFEEYIEFMHDLADASDSVTLEYFRNCESVENKDESGFDPVTAADRKCEEAIRSLIEAKYPDHGIIGEEFGGVRKDSEFVWVLDPIDGTRAFISGIPLWGTLIGLTQSGRSVAGMMSQPFTRERFFGDYSGAYRQHDGNVTPLRTRSCEKLDEAVLFTTSPTLFDSSEYQTFKKIESSVRMFRFGTDCYGYAMLAAGLADLVIESGLKQYDIAALIPIVEGAGGIVTDWQGNRPDHGGQVIACGDSILHDITIQELN